jgi:hypothetical protein
LSLYRFRVLKFGRKFVDLSLQVHRLLQNYRFDRLIFQKTKLSHRFNRLLFDDRCPPLGVGAGRILGDTVSAGGIPF